MGFLTVGLLEVPASMSANSEQAIETDVPSFFTHIPAGHFVGVSAPSNSLAEARQSAIRDVARQITAAMGMAYSHHLFIRVSGNVRNPRRVINDTLSGASQGIVTDVEANIVKSSWVTDATGSYIFFMLVYYPDKKILKMRKLSNGAKLTANIISKKGPWFELKVSEIHGVSVIISSAKLRVRQTNRFAGIITLFFWKVPQVREQIKSICLDIDPVMLCGNSARVPLPMIASKKKLVDYLTGATIENTVELQGQDEVGRPVTVKITF
jgi:hypothetical protein